LKLLLIVNASASSVTARARVVIQKSLAADHDVTVAETSRQGHATRLAQGAAAKGTDAVIVLGGDGTFNEAANGLAGTDCALGVLPGGSTNVFARTIGMTNDPIEATGELLAALGGGLGGIRPIGLGNVNGRRYLFHVGVGFDAAVVSQVEKRSALKRYLGHAFFAYTALRTWAVGYDRRHPHFSIVLGCRDGREVTVEAGYFAILMNTNPYTFLGDRPFNLAPGTGLDTPLTAVVLRSLSAFTLLGLAAAALRAPGRPGEQVAPPELVERRRVTIVADVVRATLEGPEPVPYQVDGEPLGDATRLDFRWEPETLRLIVPGRSDPRLSSGL
jgi:diacylglycerol kinase family enzyme